MKPKDTINAWALNSTSSMDLTEMIEVRTDGGRRYKIRSIVLPEEVYGREWTARDMAWCLESLVVLPVSTSATAATSASSTATSAPPLWVQVKGLASGL